MKRLVSGIMLTLVLIGVLFSPFIIQRVGASGTIYIRPDGSVDPPTALIQRVGDVYTFMGNIYDAIVVQRSNVIIDGAGYTLQGDALSPGTIGFRLDGIDGVTIKRTNIRLWDMGIRLYQSSLNNISENNIANAYSGVSLYQSSSTDIGSNTITGVGYFGVELIESSNNKVCDNDIQNCVRMVGGFNAADGVFLQDSCNNNVISGNNLSNNGKGLTIQGDSHDNIVFKNHIENNEQAGVDVSETSTYNNKFYHNSFIQNNRLNDYKWQVNIDHRENVWDDGYPSGGNYWSDYTGVDEKSGPSQSEAGNDGIGDTPYIIKIGGEIPTNSQDNYPLMGPSARANDWTFAIITDLHIGRGYSNYNEEDYYLTIRLQNAVEWINSHAQTDAIRFVVVLGDLTENGKNSEMQKTKEILNGLAIAYFPVIGNHDVDRDSGDLWFDSCFDTTFFNRQCRKLHTTWNNGGEYIPGSPGINLQNYNFTYGDVNFVFLDFVNRQWPYGQAVLHGNTKGFLEEQLAEGGSAVLFSHHPMIRYPSYQIDDPRTYASACFTDENIETLSDIISANSAKVLGNFAGHIHGYFDPDKNWDPNAYNPLAKNPVFLDANWDYTSDFSTPAGISVIGTEALMVGSNDPSSPMSKGAIRIVKVPQNTFPISTYVDEDIPSLNPYVRAMIYPVDRNPALYALHHQVVVDFQGYAFTKRFDAAHPIRYKLYLDDNLIEEATSSSTELVESKNHRLAVGTTHKIALEVYGDSNALVESITDGITIPRPEILHTYVYSPVDIIVTDPNGHTISKQVNDIPQATYTEVDLDGDGDLDKLVLIVNPIGGDYVVTLNGTGTGTYSMIAEFASPRGSARFTATEIPISLSVRHQYTIDWDALSQGGEGVIVQVDSDRDGVFEQTFNSDSELTSSQFIPEFPSILIMLSFTMATLLAVTLLGRKKRLKVGF